MKGDIKPIGSWNLSLIRNMFYFVRSIFSANIIKYLKSKIKVPLSVGHSKPCTFQFAVLTVRRSLFSLESIYHCSSLVIYFRSSKLAQLRENFDVSWNCKTSAWLSKLELASSTYKSVFNFGIMPLIFLLFMFF